MTERMDTAAYLDELAQTLASHGSNLAALRMAELEQKVSPSLAWPGVPSAPGAPPVGSPYDVAGKVAWFADVANALADSTFEQVPLGAESPELTTSWAALGEYWEGRYTLNSGTAPSFIKIELAQERGHKDNDLNSSRVAVNAWNQTGGPITGSVTYELRSRPVVYDPGYSEPPFMVGVVRAISNLLPGLAEVEVELRTVTGSDALRANSGFVSIPYTGAKLRPRRYWTATDPTVVLPETYPDWYIVFRFRVAYTNIATNNMVAWLIFAEPSMVQAWSSDPPPYAPLLGGWEPPLTKGWQPYAYMPGFDGSATYTTALTLAAVGGCLAIPVTTSGNMLLRQVSIWNTDTSTARSWNWALYDRRWFSSTSAAVLTRIAYGTAADAWTPSVASKRTIVAATPGTLLAPGIYWLVIQNNHATSTFGLGSVASGTLSHNRGQTKTLTVPVGATLDFTAATWTKTTGIYAVVLEGRAFGQSSVF